MKGEKLLVVLALIIGVWILFGNLIKTKIGSLALRYGQQGGAPFDPRQRAQYRGAQTVNEGIDAAARGLGGFFRTLFPGSTARTTVPTPTGTGASVDVNPSVPSELPDGGVVIAPTLVPDTSTSMPDVPMLA